MLFFQNIYIRMPTRRHRIIRSRRKLHTKKPKFNHMVECTDCKRVIPMQQIKSHCCHEHCFCCHGYIHRLRSISLCASECLDCGWIGCVCSGTHCCCMCPLHENDGVPGHYHPYLSKEYVKCK